MERLVRLYPPFKVKGQSFKGQKRMTMPNQSLSLREIVKRFVRRESLPVSHEGTYEERFGDLEKLAKKDLVEQLDKVEELKEKIAGFNKRQKDREEKAKVDALKAQNDAVEKLAMEKLVSQQRHATQQTPPKGDTPA